MTIFQVDAFTNKLFGGNPAAVCPLNEWLPDEILQNIASENNLSETAFYVAKGDEFELRWLTPKAEIDLCGHATLATAFVIFEIEKSKQTVLKFHTRSGLLSVAKSTKGYTMNFPANVFNKTEVTEKMKSAIGIQPYEAYLGRDVLLLVLNSQMEILDVRPDFEKIKQLHRHGVIITAEGENTDFVSRCFVPNFGINEDPVTGSAHTILTPYWAHRLKKNTLTAQQLSERRGDLICELINDRVEISGEAVLYMQGTLLIS